MTNKKTKPKYKHNKKRNTAFLYEALIQELTKAVMEKKHARKNSIVLILKESFSTDTQLGKELEIYRSLTEKETGLTGEDVRRVVSEARRIHESTIQPENLFSEQSALIKKINKDVGASVYTNFVPSYKDYATIAQLFSDKTSIKEKVLLENKVADMMTSASTSASEMQPIDTLTYKTFVKGFNEKYDGALLEEQKEVLSRHIFSFSDNGLALKVYLNEELSRLKDVVEKSLSLQEVKSDDQMYSNTKKVLEVIDGFKTREIDNKYLSEVLKIQQLAREVTS